MSKLKFACHLIQFGGEQQENPEKVLREVADAGWEGVESVPFEGAEGLVEMATLARSLGLHIVNAGGAGLDRVRFNITLGNNAAEVPSLRRSEWGGPDPSDADFENAARTLDDILAYCDAHNIKGFHHAHLGTMLETVDDAERLVGGSTRVSGCYLIQDTCSLREAIRCRSFESENLRNRIGHVHLKDCHADDPETWDYRTQRFGEKARFRGTGCGQLRT